MDTNLIIVASVLGSVCLVLMVLVMILFVLVAGLRNKIKQMETTGRIRVQKLKMNNDRNHAFHNAGLVPDEELSKRGYSMYMPDDVESQPRNLTREYSREPVREPAKERQTGGQLVNELQKEMDKRNQRSSTAAPPFLLQAIEENKRKSRGNNPGAMNPIYKNPNYNPVNSRQSETNPNFIY